MKPAAALLCLALTLAVLDLGLTSPSGAPDDACRDMMPQHHQNKNWSAPLHQASWQGRDNFSLHVSKTVDIASEEMIKVTLKADQIPFRGFLVQAWDAERQLGEFYAHNTLDVKRACWGEAVTHSDRNEKYEVSFDWLAPRFWEYKSLHFVATVVQEYPTFYMGIRSEDIWINPVEPPQEYDAAGNVQPLAAAMLLLVAMATALFARD